MYSIRNKTVIVDKKDYFLVFENPIEEVYCYEYTEVENVLSKIDEYLKDRFFVAGFITYEAGYPLIGIEPKFSIDLPLIWFGIFEGYKISEIPKHLYNFSISNIEFDLDRQEYLEKIERIKDYLRNGYTYQVNFTFRGKFKFYGDILSFYLALRENQKVKYGRFVRYDDYHILSVSPELFFKLKDKKIITKPMKGTIRRGRFLEEDMELAKKLFSSEKNRAENLMIVDLLRNDIGMISEFGTVNTEKIFEIEKYETVFQMTSTISGKLTKDTTFSKIIKSIFPGGSITGAPKKKTMEIIQELETSPRGIYTGTIGYILPNGNAEFNIAIRTPIIKENTGEIGIGSGITWYSEPEKEYEESKLKSYFLIPKKQEEFKLIETMLYRYGKIYLLKYHLKRLKYSSKYFSFKFNKNLILQEISRLPKDKKLKVRLTLSKDGKISIESTEFIPTKKYGFIKITDQKVKSDNIFLYHKTTNRQLYDEYYEKAKKENLIDYIFLNEKGHITEGCIHNIIILKDGNYITPSRESGLLKGTMLSYLQNKYNIIEKPITFEEIVKSDKIFLCNSVSGIKRVKLIT